MLTRQDGAVRSQSAAELRRVHDVEVVDANASAPQKKKRPPCRNWTIKEAMGLKPPKLSKAPNIVWPQPEAPLPEGMSEDLGGDDNPFLEQHQELRNLWRRTTLNRYYLPISKLPPLETPDPRLRLRGKPPSCCPDWSIPRLDRVVARWDSLPRERPQLSLDDLEDIAAGMEGGGLMRKTASRASVCAICGGRLSLSMSASTGFLAPGGHGGGKRRKPQLEQRCTCAMAHRDFGSSGGGGLDPTAAAAAAAGWGSDTSGSPPRAARSVSGRATSFAPSVTTVD
mmetsp:Transcript_13062/g.28598  ORF Transcript_13062/g.28598 Transcript_13062/m.28598 type:complete len:283 (+) Transcript_13062:177-1025(+)